MKMCTEVSQVLKDQGLLESVREERQKTIDSDHLQVKQIYVNDTRYIVYLNEEEVRKDKKARNSIISSLEKSIKQWDKSLLEINVINII
ncbi:MAG: hypothetical protein LBV23_04155 [Deltaproteobacteria bacterium]|jgi:archaellum biogenesis ATPase FlaH|nr:hypothetical protein [Deltaproteobacteria bacterium]